MQDWKMKDQCGTKQIKDRPMRLENEGPNFQGRKVHDRKNAGPENVELMFFGSAVRPCVICTFCNDISSLSGEISIKFGTSDHHVSGRCWKGIQGQRSKIKVRARPNALLWQRRTLRWFGIEADLFWVTVLFVTFVFILVIYCWLLMVYVTAGVWLV